MEFLNSSNTRSRRLVAVVLLAFLVLTPSVFSATRLVLSTDSELSPAEREFGKSIKAETIQEVVTALSADDMEGRGTAQPGGDKAANYIAQRFGKLNLKPLGEKNSFLSPTH